MLATLRIVALSGSVLLMAAGAPGSPPASLGDAAAAGDVATIDRLLAAGADIDAVDESGRTPLFLAVFHSRPAAARRLLDAGADPDTPNRYASTPVGTAIGHKNLVMLELLIQYGANLQHRDSLMGWSYLHQAAESSSVAAARMLIRGGIDVDATSKHGWTPLFKATARGHPPMVTFLLDQGADATARDHKGSSPLDFAHYGAEKAREHTRSIPAPGTDFAAVIELLTEIEAGLAGPP